jgi:hypothetical protein
MYYKWGIRGMHIEFWWESQKEWDHWEDLEVGRWIIIKWLTQTVWGGMDWVDLAQDRDQKGLL